LYIKDGAGASDGLALMCEYSKIRIFSNNNQARGAIFIGKDNTMQHFDNCYVQPFTGYGLWFAGNGASFVDCTFEGSNLDATVAGAPVQSFVHVVGTSLRLEHCWFEDHYDYHFGAGSEIDPKYFVDAAVVPSVQPAHNLQVIGCVFNRDTTNQARLIHVGFAAKSVVIEGCDAIVQIGLDEGDPPSDAPHICIDASDGGNFADVTITGCIVRDGNRYFPLQVADASDRTAMLAAGRLRLPQLGAAAQNELPELHDGDTVYGVDAHQMQRWEGQNWASVATFQASDHVNVTIGGIGSTDLVPNAIPGVYRITAVLLCTATSFLASLTLTVHWVSELGAESAVLLTPSLGFVKSFNAELQIRVAASSPLSAISYDVAKFGSGGSFDLFLRAERM